MKFSRFIKLYRLLKRFRLLKSLICPRLIIGPRFRTRFMPPSILPLLTIQGPLNRSRQDLLNFLLTLQQSLINPINNGLFQIRTWTILFKWLPLLLFRWWRQYLYPLLWRFVHFGKVWFVYVAWANVVSWALWYYDGFLIVDGVVACDYWAWALLGCTLMICLFSVWSLLNLYQWTLLDRFVWRHKLEGITQLVNNTILPVIKEIRCLFIRRRRINLTIFLCNRIYGLTDFLINAWTIQSRCLRRQSYDGWFIALLVVGWFVCECVHFWTVVVGLCHVAEKTVSWVVLVGCLYHILSFLCIGLLNVVLD